MTKRKIKLEGLKNAWLSPEGEWIEAWFGGHNEIAIEIIKRIHRVRLASKWCKIVDDANCHYPYEYLETIKRWIRLETITTTSRFITTPETRLTKAQRDAIAEWNAANKLEYV